MAVEGFARAGGTEILQGTDIRVAGESAVFGVTEVQRGLFPMAGSAVRLRRQISYAVAAEMLLTGEDLPARRAYELGLVNHVVPDGQALAKAREIADRIARNGPLAVKAILATLRQTEAMPEAEAFEIEMKRRAAGHELQGRDGGPDGLHGEARAGLHRGVGVGWRCRGCGCRTPRLPRHPASRGLAPRHRTRPCAAPGLPPPQSCGWVGNRGRFHPTGPKMRRPRTARHLASAVAHVVRWWELPASARVTARPV